MSVYPAQIQSFHTGLYGGNTVPRIVFLAWNYRVRMLSSLLSLLYFSEGHYVQLALH